MTSRYASPGDTWCRASRGSRPASVIRRPIRSWRTHALRRGGAGIVVNFFFNHRAVDVISARSAAQSARSSGTVICQLGFDVREIIEHQATNGDLLPGPAFPWWGKDAAKAYWPDERPAEMKVWKPWVSSCRLRRRSKMVGPIFFILNVAVQHGGVGFKANFVRGACRVQPFIGRQSCGRKITRRTRSLTNFRAPAGE